SREDRHKCYAPARWPDSSPWRLTPAACRTWLTLQPGNDEGRGGSSGGGTVGGTRGDTGGNSGSGGQATQSGGVNAGGTRVAASTWPWELPSTTPSRTAVRADSRAA